MAPSLLIAIVMMLSAATAFAQPRGGRIQYVGGTVEQLQAGIPGELHTTNAYSMLVTTKKVAIGVPYKRINLLEYGQNANRRIAMAVIVSPLFLLSKARKHFLTVGYTDDAGNQQAMVFRVEKGNVRAVLASLEARTGLKVQFQDEEARKAGKG
jgi:hypothetical protein